MESIKEERIQTNMDPKTPKRLSKKAKKNDQEYDQVAYAVTATPNGQETPNQLLRSADTLFQMTKKNKL